MKLYSKNLFICSFKNLAGKIYQLRLDKFNLFAVESNKKLLIKNIVRIDCLNIKNLTFNSSKYF